MVLVRPLIEGDGTVVVLVLVAAEGRLVNPHLAHTFRVKLMVFSCTEALGSGEPAPRPRRLHY